MQSPSSTPPAYHMLSSCYNVDRVSGSGGQRVMYGKKKSCVIKKNKE